MKSTTFAAGPHTTLQVQVVIHPTPKSLLSAYHRLNGWLNIEDSSAEELLAEAIESVTMKTAEFKRLTASRQPSK